MWKKWIGVAALTVLAWTAYSQSLTTAPGQPDMVRKVIYVVQPNDTLWDLAGRFLNSPYYWPKIWERNSFVIDPNLIFPGDVLNLYPETEKLVPPAILEETALTNPLEEEAATVESGGAAPVAQTGTTASETQVFRDEFGRPIKVIYRETPSTGWIESGEFEKAGRIVKTEADHEMVATYDHVYIDLGSAKGVKDGDIFSAFRVSQTIYHPVTKRKLGYKILNLGQIKAVSLNENSAEAEIFVSYYDMRLRDNIRPYVPPLSAEIPVAPAAAGLQGYVVAARREGPTMGQNDVVYIDLGRSKGVLPGNVFEIFETGAAVSEKGKRIILPDVIVGTVVVLDARDQTSVCLVTETAREFVLGARIRTSPKYAAQP